MMDRDFPMSPLQAKVLVVGLLVMIVAGVVVFGGLIPGFKPNYAAPPFAYVDGRPYYYANVGVPWPSLGANSTAPERLLFHNTTYWVWVTNWYGLNAGYLRGNLSVDNGSVFGYALGGPGSAPTYAASYFEPGGSAGIVWAGGLTFEILVAAPTNATG